MTMRALLPTLLLPFLLAGCGDSTAVEADPAGTPYDGPMDVRPDHGDNASPLEASGSAGLALECTDEPRRGGGGDYVDGGLETVQDSPQAAVDDYLEQNSPQLPSDGYRVERVDDGRVLLSWDVEERTRVAFVLHDDVTDFEGDTGWGVESWSVCDPAELGAEVAEDLGVQLWTDADGRPVPTSDVTSFAGPEHCDWQDTTWVHLGQSSDSDRDYDAYVSSDEEGVFTRQLSTEPDTTATLPVDATDTGWQHDGRELWLGTRPRAAYLVSVDDESDVQRWPLVTGRTGCM